jgi:Putative lumazine-binding
MGMFALLCSALVTGADMLEPADSADEAGVRRALEAYLQGHATGVGTHMERAMHPDLRMSFVRDGKLVHRTRAEYVANFTGKPAPDEAKRKRRIVSVDITGTAAMAKIELDYPDAVLTDYMSLLKVDGEWKIVDKIFDRQPRATTPSQ